MQELYVVRHGETMANVERRFDATPPGAPLTELGLRQAERVAAWLIGRGARSSIVYVSPFLRTQQTARPFAEATDARIALCDALCEVRVGAWDGRSSLTMTEDPHYLRWLDEPEIAPPGGETLEAVFQRVSGLIGELLASHPQGEPLVLFTHQHSLRAILWHLGMLRGEDGKLRTAPNGTIMHLLAAADGLQLLELDRSVCDEPDRSGRAAI
jgi:broad specificity phosphatase PhoE